MEYKKTIKIVVDYFSSDNFQKIVEEAQIIKTKSFQDPDENCGNMKDFLKYLKIYDNNQLKICIRETNIISSQSFQADLIKS